MRLRVAIPALAVTAFTLALPHMAFAETIPFFGPIIPTAINYCPASFALFMTVVNNIIIFILTMAIVFVAPLMIAYAGFLYVVNPFNPSGIAQAKKIMLNLVVGIVIALAGWLIVDALFAVLTPGGAPFGQKWSAIIRGSGDPCLIQAGALLQLKQGQVTGSDANGGLITTPGPGRFLFDPGIDAQVSTESAALATLLTCMNSKVPAGVGRVSSISDCQIIGNCSPPRPQRDFDYCATNGCSHAANSCHYGGRGACKGSSYAVDFGDEQNTAVLSEAARACNANFVGPEASHLHVSVGSACGCN